MGPVLTFHSRACCFGMWLFGFWILDFVQYGQGRCLMISPTLALFARIQWKSKIYTYIIYIYMFVLAYRYIYICMCLHRKFWGSWLANSKFKNQKVWGRRCQLLPVFLISCYHPIKKGLPIKRASNLCLGSTNLYIAWVPPRTN